MDDIYELNDENSDNLVQNNGSLEHSSQSICLKGSAQLNNAFSYGVMYSFERFGLNTNKCDCQRKEHQFKVIHLNMHRSKRADNHHIKVDSTDYKQKHLIHEQISTFESPETAHLEKSDEITMQHDKDAELPECRSHEHQQPQQITEIVPIQNISSSKTTSVMKQEHFPSFVLDSDIMTNKSSDILTMADQQSWWNSTQEESCGLSQKNSIENQEQQKQEEDINENEFLKEN
ncbi:MAG: hypothetical protein EZS28_018567 [Streblomastix strix]|uniref:Uncharacterized protein n=1 Tax=Streblomastix strix TaxID=222440 RepID=A0A5J4VTL0_9EUKA|nr:MAG: hypothetical protein EZS28_018567 [Streblomastix strix]